MIQNNMFSTQGIQPLQMKSATESKPSTPAETIQSFGTYLQNALGPLQHRRLNRMKCRINFWSAKRMWIK